MGRWRLSEAIAVVITVVWFGSVLADAIIGKYDPPATVHALMMLAAGWAFSDGYIRRKVHDDTDR